MPSEHKESAATSIVAVGLLGGCPLGIYLGVQYYKAHEYACVSPGYGANCDLANQDTINGGTGLVAVVVGALAWAAIVAVMILVSMVVESMEPE